MKHITIAALAAILITTAAFSAKRGISYTFDTLSSVTTSESISSQTDGDYLSAHTFSVDVSGGPATCTMNIQGSLNNTLWFDLSGDQDCSADLMFHIVNKPVMFVRVNLSALSGGTDPTVDVKYAGTTDN